MYGWQHAFICNELDTEMTFKMFWKHLQIIVPPPFKSLTMETFKFNNVQQYEGQTIDNIVMELKKKNFVNSNAINVKKCLKIKC